MAQFLSIPVTSKGNQLISARNVLLVEQATATTVTIVYVGGNITEITHATQASGYEMRDVIQDALVLAHNVKSAPSVVISVTPTKAVGLIVIS
jgi:hypothetical protein